MSSTVIVFLTFRKANKTIIKLTFTNNNVSDKMIQLRNEIHISRTVTATRRINFRNRRSIKLLRYPKHLRRNCLNRIGINFYMIVRITKTDKRKFYNRRKRQFATV